MNQSLAYYQSSTSFSPNNAQLWNKQASVRFIKGDTQGALADLDRSLSLDQRYQQTDLLRGDMLAYTGDAKGALAAYNMALALQPNDVSLLSIAARYSAQTGDVPAALNDYDKLIAIEKPPYDSAHQQLSALDTQAAQAGGYAKLGASLASRQQSLQSTLESHRSQLEAAYYDEALALREAGRPDDALTAAQSALAVASASDTPSVKQLLTELQQAGTK